MNNTAAIGDRSTVARRGGDEPSHGRLTADREAYPAGAANLVAAMDPDPVPDPTWDRVMQASWESFPASDAPGWR